MSERGWVEKMFFVYKCKTQNNQMKKHPLGMKLKQHSLPLLLGAIAVLVVAEDELLRVVDLSSCTGPAVRGAAEDLVERLQVLVLDDGGPLVLLHLAHSAVSTASLLLLLLLLLAGMARGRALAAEPGVRVGRERGAHADRRHRSGRGGGAVMGVVREGWEARAAEHLAEENKIIRR